MAAETFTNQSHNYAPRFPRNDAWLMFDEATREYNEANDLVKGPKIAKGCKITNAVLGFSDEFDEDATPAGVATLRLNDGITQINLVTCTATQAGTAGGFVQFLNVPAGLNYLVQTEGFWAEVIFSTAPDDVKTAILVAGVQVSSNLWGDEQRQIES